MVTTSCSQFSFSDDGGETWTNAVNGCQNGDHQTIFAGPPVSSSPIGYPNVVYHCALVVVTTGTDLASQCTKSLDGGVSWAVTGTPAFMPEPGQTGDGGVPGDCGGAHGHGIVDHRGWVYLPKGHCGQPHLAISRDEGLTWQQFQVADLGMPCCTYDSFDHEAGVGVDRDGTIYYAWVAGDRLPYLTVSHDDAATWSEPLMIGAPGLTEASLGELTVGAPGRIAFAYMGTYDSPGEPWTGDYSDTPWHGFLMMSTDAASTDPTFYTATINDPRDRLMEGPCGPIRCGSIGDFIDVVIAPDGTPWAPYVEACLGACWLFEDAPDSGNELVAGRLWGGPSLWDDVDPNGAYPGDGR